MWAVGKLAGKCLGAFGGPWVKEYLEKGEEKDSREAEGERRPRPSLFGASAGSGHGWPLLGWVPFGH